MGFFLKYPLKRETTSKSLIGNGVVRHFEALFLLHGLRLIASFLFSEGQSVRIRKKLVLNTPRCEVFAIFVMKNAVLNVFQVFHVFGNIYSDFAPAVNYHIL